MSGLLWDRLVATDVMVGAAWAILCFPLAGKRWGHCVLMGIMGVTVLSGLTLSVLMVWGWVQP